MRKWPIHITARDLATEWVILSIPPMSKESLRECQELMTEMIRRVGIENTNNLIDQARATSRMLIP